MKYWNNFVDSGSVDLTAQDTLKFWIKSKITNGYAQPAKIDKVRLEGTNWTIWAQVDFSNYNGGTSEISTNWSFIQIPLTDFTNDKSAGFSLSQVKTVALEFAQNSGSDFILLDDFEQNNGNNNSLGYWSDCYTNGGTKCIYSPDDVTAAKVGTRGAKISYTNKGELKYYNNFSETANSKDLTTHSKISFWIKANTNDSGYKTLPQIDKIRLEGTNYNIWGKVSFSNYNYVSSCQIGAFVDENDNGTTASEIDYYESMIGKQLAIVMFYINFQANFPTTTCDTIDANGSVPHIVWEPYTTDINSSIVDDIINGVYDAYIQNFATDAKNWGKKLFIRLGHEMNGNWYGWDGVHNGGGQTNGYGDPSKYDGPERYVDMWKHVWSIFSNVGATNVYWVWSPNNWSFTNAEWNNIANYYPGDKYVDWLGFSGYNFNNPDWKTFDDVVGDIYQELLNINYTKPIMISEMGCVHTTPITAKSNWIIDGFQSLKENYPHIKAYNWFNINKNGNDWRIESGEGSRIAMSNAMTDSFYTSTGNPVPEQMHLSSVTPVWQHIEIPLVAFTNDKTSNFSLSQVKSFSIIFKTNSSSGSSLFLDQIQTEKTNFSGAAVCLDSIAATSSNAGGAALFLDDIKTVTTNSSLPTVVYSTPTNNEQKVFLTKLIKVGFSKSMSQGTFNSNNCYITPNPGGFNGFGWNVTSTTLTFYYENNFQPNTTYTLIIKAGSPGVKDTLGLNLDGNGNSVDDGSPGDDFKVVFTTIAGMVGIPWYDDDDITGNDYKDGSWGGTSGGYILTDPAGPSGAALPISPSSYASGYPRRGNDAIYLEAFRDGGASYWVADIGHTVNWNVHNFTNLRNHGGWVEFWVKGYFSHAEFNIGNTNSDVAASASLPLVNYVTPSASYYRKVKIRLDDSAWDNSSFDWSVVDKVKFDSDNVANISNKFYIDDIYFVDPTPDTTPPKITFIHPWSNAQATYKRTKIIIKFNEAMWQDATENAITITPNPGPMFFTWALGGSKLYISFTNDLQDGVTYTVTVSGATNGARDVWGNPLDGNGNGISDGSPTDDYVWSFTVRDIPMLPTIVSTQGYKIMVRKRKMDGTLTTNQPFWIKGVCYDPAFPGESGNSVARTYVKDATMLKDLNANCIRTYWPWNANNYFEDSIIATNVLNELYYQGVYVIMYCYKSTNNQKLNYTNTINAFKNHPAILMWSWGNEPNASFNNYWGYGSVAGVQTALESFAQAVHSLDPNHPPTTAWYQIPTQSDVNNVPSLDIWGFTCYRGPDWQMDQSGNTTNVFVQWQNRSTKPMFFQEHGCDRYLTWASMEDPTGQANAISKQFTGPDGLKWHLSYNGTSSTNNCGGGLVFEFKDDWRKYTGGSDAIHDTTASYYNAEYAENPPNDISNPNMQEEWWGIMDAYDNEKIAYTVCQTNWQEDPAYFIVVHDGIAQQNIPETIEIHAVDRWGVPLINYQGVISLFTLDGTPSSITWYNGVNNYGVFTNTGNGTAKYTFSADDRGVVQFRIVDSTVESINIEVRDANSTSITDDDTEGYLKFEAGPPTINMYKYIYSINLGAKGTNSNPPLSQPKPGTTITYKLVYTNSGIGTSLPSWIYDNVPTWATYLTNSIKFALGSGSTSDSAQYKTDDAGDDNSFYSNNRLTFTPDNGLSPDSGGSIPPGSSGVFFYRYVIKNIRAGSNIGNLATFTSANYSKFNCSTVYTQVATNYGGRFSFIADASNSLQPTYISVSFTNKGNSIMSFPLKITNLSSDISLTNWTVSIVSNNNDTIINTIQDLDINQSFSFRIKVVPHSGVAVGNWIEFAIRAQAGNNTTATSYMGDDGIEYGGDIGKDVNGTPGANPGFIFQQNNPAIRVKMVPLPFQFISSDPTNYQQNVQKSGLIIDLTFNNPVDSSTANSSSISIYDSDFKPVPASYSVNNSVISITITTNLKPNEFYTIEIRTNLKDTLAQNLSSKTDIHFYTEPGNETIHKYRVPQVANNSLADWTNVNNYTNNCFYMSNLRPGGEQIAYDSNDTLATQINRIYATWDLNYLYLVYRNVLLSGNEFWVYVALDTTRDDKGASFSPENKSIRTFTNYRKPEMFLYFPHLKQTGNASYDDTQNLRLDNSFIRYKWLGSTWDSGTSMGRGGVNVSVYTDCGWTPSANYNGQDNMEIRIPWSAFGDIPNRIAISVWISSASNSSIIDYCPDNSSGSTNWVTIDPDNNDDDVPDKATSFPPDHFTIVHDGSGTAGGWEQFIVTVKDMFGNKVTDYAGVITLDTILGNSSQISFSNYSGNGTFTDLGSGKARYVWPTSDNGIVTLFIKDNVADTVNIRVKSTTGLNDDNTEGNLIFSNPPAVLSISKTSSVSNANVNDIITYKIIISNESSYKAYNVKVTDPIPYGVSYVSNSLKMGDISSTYASATPLSDSSGDDEGSYNGSQVIFCVTNGIAPTTGGVLESYGIWVVYFQVKVNATNITGGTNIIYITNKDSTFDGICTSDLTVDNSGYLRIGDTAGSMSNVSTNIYQFATDRDHHIYINYRDNSYTGVDGTTFRIGNEDLAGPNNYEHYAFLTFGLGDIPPGSTVTSATLFIKESAENTAAMDWPFYVDFVKYSNVYDTTSDLANRFNINPPRTVIESGYYSFNSTPGVGNWLAVPSTSQVQYAMTNLKSYTENGSQRIFQVRIRDGASGSSGFGYIDFYSQNDTSVANRPYLKVYYLTGTPGKEVRALTGFNLNPIPSTANITSATLYLYGNNLNGNAVDIQPIIVDSVDYGPTLDGTDYNATVIDSSFATFNATTSSWVALAAKSQVSNAFVNNKGWSKDGSSKWFQIRLRPTSISSNDGEADVQNINSVDSSSFLPYLKVTYVLPPSTNGPASYVTNIAKLNTVYATNIVSVTVASQSNVVISISKSVSNVKLGGANSTSIPGATISYLIICSNKSSVSASNIIIYDKIDVNNVLYKTNGDTTPPGWIIEWSTNSTPDQSYSSPDYTTTSPPVLQIKWVRWKKSSFTGYSYATFGYKVIIK